MFRSPYRLGAISREPWRDLPDGRQAETHWFALSDLHGCPLAFTRLLAERPPGARLIFLGDAVDRGPDSLEVLRTLDADQDAVLLHGNHELMAWCALHIRENTWVRREAFRIWTGNGGDITLRQFRQALETGQEERDPENPELPALFSRIFARMRPWHEDGDLFFVHGGVAPDNPEASLDAAPEATRDAVGATWDHADHYAWYRQPQSPVQGPVIIRGRPRFIVHGHTPQPPDACLTPYALDVDVGYGMKCAVEIQGRRFRRLLVTSDEITGRP